MWRFIAWHQAKVADRKIHHISYCWHTVNPENQSHIVTISRFEINAAANMTNVAREDHKSDLNSSQQARHAPGQSVLDQCHHEHPRNDLEKVGAWHWRDLATIDCEQRCEDQDPRVSIPTTITYHCVHNTERFYRTSINQANIEVRENVVHHQAISPERW